MRKRTRISLSGAALQAADRIIAETQIENYSELINLLLRRYEKDFIEACNGFFLPSPGQNDPPVPSMTATILEEREQPGQYDPPVPQKTAKQRLMDFDD